MAPIAKAVKFDGILNFRDVGHTINNLAISQIVAEGRLFRSGRPDEASAKDRQRLKDEFKIKTVIDLRTKSEHVKQARARHLPSPTYPPASSNTTSSQSLDIPGLCYRHININGGGFERALLRQLSLWSALKLLVLMLFNYRMQAIEIVGREVMQPKGLIGLGRDSLDHAGREIREIMLVAADPENVPLLLHCTQGKDRTGASVLLILMLLGVKTEWIAGDYALSQRELEPEREERLREILEVGLTPDFVDCDPEWVPAMVRYIDEKYGGIRNYLAGIGVTEGQMDAIVKNFKA